MANKIFLNLLFTAALCVSSVSSLAAVREAKTADNAMVASDHYLASKAGAEIMKKGGNAVDAAVTTSLVLSVLRNQSTGIGGGGFMVLRLANGETTVVDYRETAPAKASRDMFLDENKKPIPDLSTKGYKAVAVPGNLAGLDYVLQKYGTMKFAELLKPAIEYAEKGFPVDKHLAGASKTVFERGAHDSLVKLFFNNGKPKVIGEWQKNPDLAKTLKLIADKGVKEFYRGSIAQKIAEAMQKNGGLITLEDLKNYQPRIRQPLKGKYRDLEIITMPPPSSGGVALLETLNLLENFELGWNSSGHGSSRHVHLVTEAMKHAFADRAEFLGDPDFVDVPVKRLISKEYSDLLRKKINEQKTLPLNEYGTKGLTHELANGPVNDSGTTHFSVVDPQGNIVSATETINTFFGSQVVIPDTGIVMNNEMDDFSKQPGVPNAFGLVGNEANSIHPGKKPLSSMTPTIVLKNNKPLLAVGASGGPRIITGTLHAIINVADFGMSAEEALSFQRFHHQWLPDKLFIERDLAIDVRENLKKMGHELAIGEAESAVQVILLKDGKITAASDPRKGGLPEGF